MALFLSPIPQSVLTELEIRSNALGDSSGGNRVDLGKINSGASKWSHGRTPFIRAASFAVIRDSINPEFQKHWEERGQTLEAARESFAGGEIFTAHDKKHYHRLKNVLHGGGLIDKSGETLDSQVYTNMVDDFATYNSGYGGHLSEKLTGYKTDTSNRQGKNNPTPNSRMGVPSPGIVSVTCENVGSLGSLKKIDMEVECHDFGQLQMIESLFMSPGVSVLLEWGWSVNTSGTDVQGLLVDLSDASGLSNVAKLHEKLLLKSKQAKYSYEGAVATITNYSWSAKANGSFSCNISLRSRGEALLGTQVKSAHAPLFESIRKISSNAKSGEFKITADDGTNRKFDSDKNMAQNYLETHLGTQPNNYYPSFHAAARYVGINGKVPGGDIDTLNLGTTDVPPFPRWYYTYNAINASQRRGAISDSAKNSILQGKKGAGAQQAQAAQIAKDTIANYVSQILAPAIAKNSYGNGIIKGTKSPDVPQWNKSNWGGTMGDYGLRMMHHDESSIAYGQMTGQKWRKGLTGLTNGYTKYMGFDLGGSPAPWTKNREPLNMDYTRYFNSGHGNKWTGVPTADTAKVSMMYRPHIGDGKYGLLFGGYHPMGNGGDWGKSWQSAISDPLRQDFKGNMPISLNNAFYQYYNRIWMERWPENLGGNTARVDTGGMDSSFNGVTYLNEISHPLLHLVSRMYMIFASNSSTDSTGLVHKKTTVISGLGNAGNKMISAAGPLGVLGLAMKQACTSAGASNTLGFGAGFEGITAYIQKHFKKIPTSTDVAGYIGGVNPITKVNFYHKKTSISGAQSAWSDLDMVVGEGDSTSSKSESYGLPHKFTKGKVGRYLGAIHVKYPNKEIHARLQSGINLLKRTTDRRLVSGWSDGIYAYGSKTKEGYDNIEESFGGTDGRRDSRKVTKYGIRTLPSTSWNQDYSMGMMDYPMPMWGHYSKLDRKGNFEFVNTIAKNKKKFMNEVKEKKKNASLLTKSAFGEAYKKYEEYRQITDGDVFIPYSVLEKIINDNIGMQTEKGSALLRFDSGDQLLAGKDKDIPENSMSDGYLWEVDNLATYINEYNDTGYKLVPASYKDVAPSAAISGIQPINIGARMKDYAGEVAKQTKDGEAVDSPSLENYAYHFGFSDSSNNLTTYFYGKAMIGDEEGKLPTVLYQTVSLPSKICNHKFLASTDPRVCILPGQTGVTSAASLDDAPEIIGDDAGNEKIAELKEGFKLFTDDPDRGYGHLTNILINTEFIFKCFDKSTTIKDALQKILDGCSGACGNIWNFKFQIDGGVDSGVTRIIDANFANAAVDIVAEFPVQRTDSIVRSYSLESKIPNAMAVQALYGNNTTVGDGTVPNTLYELGNMFVDMAHENIQVPIQNTDTEAGEKTFQIPKSATKRVQALGHLLSHHVHDSLGEEHVSNCDRLLKTILNDRAKSGPGDNALLDHNIIPLKMSLEIDGISGIHFGHAITATHLPQRYKDTVVFQITNVKHSISTSGWTTTIDAIMRRRPLDMGVYRIGSGGGTFDANQIIKLTKDQLTFSKNPINWYHEGIQAEEMQKVTYNTINAAEQAGSNNLSE